MTPYFRVVVHFDRTHLRFLFVVPASAGAGDTLHSGALPSATAWLALRSCICLERCCCFVHAHAHDLER